MPMLACALSPELSTFHTGRAHTYKQETSPVKAAILLFQQRQVKWQSPRCPGGYCCPHTFKLLPRNSSI